jgi:hypothetical protein
MTTDHGQRLFNFVYCSLTDWAFNIQSSAAIMMAVLRYLQEHT